MMFGIVVKEKKKVHVKRQGGRIETKSSNVGKSAAVRSFKRGHHVYAAGVGNA